MKARSARPWPILLLLITGCIITRPVMEPAPGNLEPIWDGPVGDEVIQVLYLGTGGYLFQRGGRAVLTAPLYSNPGHLRVGFGRLAPDTARIDRFHPALPPEAVGAILVGHAHYDHLLDVPYIARKHHPRAVIYGSPSVRRLVVAAEPYLAGRTVAVDSEVARNRLPGHWFYLADSTIRFMALESAHGPHSLGVHLMQGEVQEGLRRVPRSAWRWREGETLAWLIDFLSTEGAVDFRIYYQDATSPDSTGLPPRFAPANTHRIDLAVLSVGSSFVLEEYPELLLGEIQPRYVILGHWENFFRSLEKPPRRLLFSHIEDFVADVERTVPDADWLLPRPGAVYRFQPADY